MLTISKDFTFEASHVLPKHPGQCSRLHGHSWKLTVEVRGEPNPETGFVMDYGDLKKVVNRAVIDKVDHQHLGYGSLVTTEGPHSGYHSPLPPDFYPSSENLIMLFVYWLEGELHRAAPELALYRVTLHETCTSAATWRVDD